MLRKIFNLKVFLISSLFTLLFGSCVFANDFSLPAPLPKNFSNHYLVVSTHKGYEIYEATGKVDKFLYKPCSDGDVTGDITYHGTYNIWEFKDDSWKKVNVAYGSVNLRDKGYYANKLVYSTDNVYNSAGDVFFSAPVKPISIIDLPMTIMGQIKIILPIGISALCLVGLVPYLVKSLRKFL